MEKDKDEKYECECQKPGPFCGKKDYREPRLVCTRDDGHNGMHVACTSERHGVATWR